MENCEGIHRRTGQVRYPPRVFGGFYRCFDMGTTSMSVMGDLSATVLIDRLEKKRNAKQKVAEN